MSKLPKTIYVRWDGVGSEQYLTASTSKQDAIEDDGPSRVGTYQLVEEHILTKTVQEKKAPKVR